MTELLAAPVAKQGEQAKGPVRVLDIGSGSRRLRFPGADQVIRLDIREGLGDDYIRHDARDALPFPDEHFQRVFSSHMIEHMTESQARVCLPDWWRVVAPNGTLQIMTVNLEWAAQRVIGGIVTREVRNALWGPQEHEHDIHKHCYTMDTLVGLVSILWGLKKIQRAQTADGYEICVIVKKISDIKEM